MRDWPNLPFRAIRLYVPGPGNVAFFNRFLEDFMALFKFNKVVLELNCMRLDKHPEVNTGWIEFAKYMQYTRSNSTEGVRDIDVKDLKEGFVTMGPKTFRISGKSKSKGNSLVAVGAQGTGQNFSARKVEGIKIDEDVSSLLFLHACAKQAGNQKAYFNIPDMFDSSDLLGYYEVVYEDGYKIIIPIQYGVNIMEWNMGGEKSLDKREGETGSPQLAYCYEADPIDCSGEKNNPILFYAYEWTNPRFGKVIKEINLVGSTNFQALQQDYGKPVTQPMEGNAILLAAVSKVKKQEPFPPRK